MATGKRYPLVLVLHGSGAIVDGLLTALVADLRQRYPIDAQRIHITGFSMGASAAKQVIVHAARKGMARMAVFAMTEPARRVLK
ncbi:hypothetical protein GTP44_22375 [Duganella sp. FT50W]|uniref:Phospholipase/carboxylesterase/thioesterase domain-containing protein n=1 Tax=Duganella lactea TaxID=2692173 RepID=A0A6L8MRJ9_9BURK|nr:hypothetical protein [Duganella lactea]MYM84681.1 hypothetical protein [Duganella lactea]